jgi:hypothetical protein
MPVLDANALETDPEGMAFLRAVLKPTAEKQGSAPGFDACAEAKRAFQVAPPTESGPMSPATPEPAAAVPAAA